MHLRLKPWQSFLLIAAAIGLLTYGVQRFRYRAVRQQADLVDLLPQRAEAAVFFIHVAALRHGQVLSLLNTSKTQDPEYQKFIRETGFDYARDLDAVAGSKDERESYFVLQGRFDWTRIQQYARDNGGHCQTYCSLPLTGIPGKWLSFRQLQPDVIALASSQNSGAVQEIGSVSRTPSSIPSRPIWVRLPASALEALATWPGPLRILATTLHAAHSLTLSADGSSAGGLQLELDARFENGRIAETVRNQLELETKMLRLELGRENQKPNDADVTGMLVAGSFQLVNQDVVAIWPIRRELLETLEIQ